MLVLYSSSESNIFFVPLIPSLGSLSVPGRECFKMVGDSFLQYLVLPPSRRAEAFLGSPLLTSAREFR